MSRAIWKRDGGLPEAITEALNETGLPWSVEPGKKHRKIMLGGKLVGVVPLKGMGGRNSGDNKNIVSAIRRANRA
jgi:hypothetical protein